MKPIIAGPTYAFEPLPFYVNVYRHNQTNTLTGKGTSRKRYVNRQDARKGSRYYGQEAAIYRVRIIPKVT